MNLDALYASINEATNRDYAQQSLVELIGCSTETTPDKIAVLCGEDSQTYAELDERSEALANLLCSLGVRSGDLVGLCCDRYVDTPALLIGIMKCGAGYVPLDPEYPAERLAYMVENSQLSHIVANSNQIELTSHFAAPVTVIDQCWENAFAAPPRKPHHFNPTEDVAYVIYTSGSTGRPKGVVVQHSAVVNLLLSMSERPGFTPDDRILATTTLSFDISVLEMFLPLATGGSVAVVDRDTAKNTPALIDAMHRHEVNCVQATPAMWRMIVEADFQGREGLKFLTGGEPLPRDLVAPMLDRCSEVWNVYGPTETTVWSTAERITSDEERILIGRPIANTQIYIVDEEDQLCGPGQPGELLIGGDGVTLGYLNRPELTTERFVDFRGQRVYRTGDLAQLTVDGRIDHLGRMDSQIKFNGHRIELEEIDAAIAAQPGVRQAATVLREDRPGDKRLVAYILPASDGESSGTGSDGLDLTAIKQGVTQRLPSYMVPNVFTQVEQFHYTPSGKLDRKSFPPPATRRPDIDVDFVPPRTAEEKTLASLWCDILQIDRVGTHDNFFELGGNSIRATNLMAQVERDLGTKIAPGAFFDAPTIVGLLELLAPDNHKDKSNSSKTTKRGRSTQSDDAQADSYAIVGMAVRMPGAANLQEYWQNLLDGVESITHFSPEELAQELPASLTASDNYVAARGIVDQADYFDAKFFGIAPKVAEVMDPQQRIVLELAWTALEDAGIIPSKTSDTIGVWAGAYTTSYFTKNLLSRPDVLDEYGEFNAGIVNEKDYIATRVAHALNLKGPAINVNTACSTSLVALIEACKSLAAGDCDVALAGGVSITFPQKSGHLHQTDSIFTPDGHCRPFDSQAAGTMFSDGAGIVAVRRLSDAIAAGDRIYAVVKGYGINNDGGEKASFSAPSISGQADAIAMAHEMAGFTPETISYVEAHGTATPIGDPIEVAALRSVFASGTDQKQFCALGSVKSNIGHTVAAAGVAGLAKVALALHHEQLPATLHFQKPNPAIEFDDSPFYVCTENRAWPRDDAAPSRKPRRAAVSSFGVGGTNAHIALEEAPTGHDLPNASEASANSLPLVVVPVSAKCEAALEANIGQLTEALARTEHSVTSADIHQIAAVLQTRREAFRHRAAVVAGSTSEAINDLSQPSLRLLRRSASAARRDIVFMFPGQGAQYVRMGQDIYEHSEVFRKQFDTCCEILTPLLNRDLRDVLFPPSGDEESAQDILRATQYTQPALFALGYSLGRMWQSWGLEPALMVGHSIGEFAAATLAGVFSLEDALKIIAHRGQAIATLPEGSMLSVRAAGEQVAPLLSGDLAVASYNGPQLCVVSGPSDQVAKLHQQLEGREIACKPLHTSHAFHSPMMSPIIGEFEQYVSQFELRAPEITILSTVTGQWLTSDEATNPGYWANHLRAPVNFSKAIAAVWDEEEGDPSRILVELGPRQTLATLARQHASDPKQQIAVPTLSDRASDRAEWRCTLTAVASLWLAGIDVDWDRINASSTPRASTQHLTLPTYAFQRKRFYIAPSKALTRNQVHLAPTESDQTTSTVHQPTVENTTVSRLPNIVTSIEEVFESTSGFELGEFDSETTFFEMGLDSLVLTQTATALQREFGVEVTFRQLLEQTSSVDLLASWLDQQLPADKYLPEPTTSTEVPSPAASSSDPDQPPIDLQSHARQPVANPPVQAHPIPAPVGRNQSVTQQAVVQHPSSQQPVAPQPAITPQLLPVAAPGGSDATNLAQLQLQAQLQLMQQQMSWLSGGQPSVASPALTPPAATPTAASQSAGPQAELSEQAQPAAEAPAATTPATAPEKETSQTNASKLDGADSAASDAELAPQAKRFKTVKLNDGELDAEQQTVLDEMIRINNVTLAKSKAYAQTHREYLADPRTVSGFRPNLKEMTHPIVVDRSQGVHLWDLDGNQYIDFTCGFGSNLLGHAHPITIEAVTQQVQQDYSIGPQSPLAGEVAKLFCDVTGSERMAFSNTGSEAVLGCTRLARNYTGRDLIVMFNGDYHGILDEVIARGSKKLKSFPAATGIPKEHVGNTLILDYGSDESLEIIAQNIDRLAAVLVEPVQSRRPELQPREFLQKLAKITENEPTALIFDEVITGLRIGLGGAQEHFGVKADLASYGKIVGGGMPIGVVAGKAKYLDGLDGGFWNFGDDSRPEAGMTYFAGTFVRHPITLAASKAILEHLKAGGQPMYDRLNELADYLGQELNRVFRQLGAPLRLEHFGSLFKIQFEQEVVYSEVFFSGLRRRGMHIWDHRPCLLTLAHRHEHIDAFAQAAFDTIVECQRYGFMPGDGYQHADITFDSSRPPQVSARAGTDDEGNPGWFVPDAANPGQFIQLGIPTA